MTTGIFSFAAFSIIFDVRVVSISKLNFIFGALKFLKSPLRVLDVIMAIASLNTVPCGVIIIIVSGESWFIFLPTSSCFIVFIALFS